MGHDTRFRVIISPYADLLESNYTRQEKLFSTFKLTLSSTILLYFDQTGIISI